MNSRKYKTDINELIEKGKAIMASSVSSEDAKYLFRVFAVNMVLSGCKASEVSELAGVSSVSISNWVKTADEKGFEALKSKKSSGRPPRLSTEQMNSIDKVLQSDPNKYGFKVWDGPSLSEYIKITFNVGLGVRRCQELFHKLGYSRIRPQTFPSKEYEETEERTEFKKNQRHRG